METKEYIAMSTLTEGIISPKMELQILQDFDSSVLLLGDIMELPPPVLTPPLDELTDKSPLLTLREIRITKQLIDTLRKKYYSYAIGSIETAEYTAARIHRTSRGSLKKYARYVNERNAVTEIWKKGRIVLKFEWKTDTLQRTHRLYATTGKVQTKEE